MNKTQHTSYSSGSFLDLLFAAGFEMIRFFFAEGLGVFGSVQALGFRVLVPAGITSSATKPSHNYMLIMDLICHSLYIEVNDKSYKFFKFSFQCQLHPIYLQSYKILHSNPAS